MCTYSVTVLYSLSAGTVFRNTCLLPHPSVPSTKKVRREQLWAGSVGRGACSACGPPPRSGGGGAGSASLSQLWACSSTEGGIGSFACSSPSWQQFPVGKVCELEDRLLDYRAAAVKACLVSQVRLKC